MNPTTTLNPVYTVDQTKPPRRSRSAPRHRSQLYKGITLLKSSGRYKTTVWDWQTMKNINVGHFRLAAQAAYAYDNAIRHIRGTDAIVNFETQGDAIAAIRASVLLLLISKDHTHDEIKAILEELKTDLHGRKLVSKMYHHWQSLILKTEFPVELKPGGFICSLYFRNQPIDRKTEILDEAYDPEASIFWKLYRQGLNCQGVDRKILFTPLPEPEAPDFNAMHFFTEDSKGNRTQINLPKPESEN